MLKISSREFFEAIRPARDLVLIKDVPESLRPDLNAFIFGKTVVKRDGELAVYPTDFNEWIYKLQNQGLDYDIQLI